MAVPAPKKSGGGGGGFLGAISRIPAATARDLYDVAVETPGGLYALHKALAKADPSNLRHVGHSDTSGVKQLGKAYFEQLKQTAEHPLRHPGVTLLTVAPVVGGISRTAEAATVAARAGRAGGAMEAAIAGAKALAKPTIGERTINVDGAVSRGHYSRAATARVTQKGVDKVLQSGLPGTRRPLLGRAAKLNERTLRVQEARERAAGTRVAKLGQHLKPAEQRALRIVAEEVPIGRRTAAQELRAARATDPKEIARHRERIDLNKAAAAFIDESSGKPVLRDARLQKVYDALDRAAGERGGILKSLDLLDAGAQEAAKLKTARFAAGARTVKGGVPVTIDRLKVGDKVMAPGGAGKVTFVNRKTGDVRVTSYDPANRAWDERTHPVSDLDKPGSQVVGAEDIRLTPNAPFIGNPVERSRLTGKPRVSSRSTFGHKAKPGSLKEATGGAVEHGLERQDVTNIVAERHAEAVRLNDITRRVALVKGAGKATPRRADDVWVWTDKTVSNERIPQEVRKYIDNPDAMRQLSDRQQQSVLQQLRAATFERHDWHADPEARHQFEELAKKGKGIFVPRRLLGNAAKAEPHLPAEGAIDAVNNAQKTALVYLKVAYPVVQTFSNAAMTMIQGIAHPARIAKAVRIDRAMPPEYSAVVEDIMGEGAVVQAQFEGKGMIAHASQRVAHAMSSTVDRPFRKNAFYQEAIAEGFDTPAKIIGLLEDEKNVNKLVEVAQRGKEAIVDFGEMGPTESNVIRRLLFVYPWQKGATKYAAHFLRDHPVQAAALAQVGLMATKQNAATLGPTPSYLRGVFDTGGGRLVNPAGLNFFQTPASIGQALANPTSGALQNFLAPAPGGIVAGLSGRDDIGRPLPKNPAAAARHVFIEGIPAVRAARAGLSDRSPLAHALLGPSPASKTFPNAQDAYWSWFLGGLHGRKYDKGALNKNAALQKSGR